MTTSRSHVTKSDWDYDDVNSAYYSNSVWSSHYGETDPEADATTTSDADPDLLDKKQDHKLPKNSPSFKSSKTRKQANVNMTMVKDTEMARPPHANIHIDMVPPPIATTPSSTYTSSPYRINAFHDEPAPHYSTVHHQVELQQMEEYTKASSLNNKDVAAGEDTVTPTVSTAGSTGEGTGTKVTGGNTNLVSTTNATMPSHCPTLIESNFHMAPPLTDANGYLIQPLEIHLIPESPPSVTPPKSVATETVFSITSIQIPVKSNGKDDMCDADNTDGKEDAGKHASSSSIGAHNKEENKSNKKTKEGKERDKKSKSKKQSHDKKKGSNKKDDHHKKKSKSHKSKSGKKIDKVKLRESVREKRRSYHDSKRDLLLPLTDQDSGNVMQEPAPLPIPKPEELQQIYAQWNMTNGNDVGNGNGNDPPPKRPTANKGLSHIPMMNASNPSVATHKVSNHQNSQWGNSHRNHNSARSLLTATMGAAAAGRRHSHSHQHPQQRQSSSLRRLLTQTNAAAIKTNNNASGYGCLSFAERSNGKPAAAATSNHHKMMVGSFRGISVGNRQPPEGGSIRLSKSSQGVLVLEEDSAVENPPPMRTRPQLSPEEVEEALQQRAMELELHFAHIKETASAVQESDGSGQERQDEEVESDEDEDDDEEDVGEEIFTTSHASGNLSQRLLAIRRHNKSTEDMDGLQYTHKEDYSSVHSKSIRSKASAKKKKKKKKSKTEPHHVQDSQQGSRMKKTRGQHDDSPGDAAPVLPSTGYQRDSSKEFHPAPPREVKVRPSLIANHPTHRSSSRSHLSAPAPPATHHSARNLKDPLPKASDNGRKQMHSLNVVASSQPVDLDNDSSVISAPPPPYLPRQLREDQPEEVDASRCLPRSLRDNVVLRFFSFTYMYMVAPLVRGRGSGNKKAQASDGRHTQGNINDLMMPTDHTSSYAVDEDEHAVGVEQPRPQVRHSSRSESRCRSPDTNDVIYV